MPVNRPTFSESWYRIASLRPRLRPMVQTYRQQHRGRVCHVIQDPSNNNFFRLEEPAYRFLGLLDGRRTVGEVWLLANEQLGDDGPTQNEAVQVLGQLYTSNLLEGDMPSDAAGLFERYRKRIRGEVSGYLMNLLSMRLPLFDPDRLLNYWAGVFTRVFTWPAFLIWVALIAAGLSCLIGRGPDLLNRASGTLDPDNLFLLYLATIGIKLIHEFGHAFACKRFGQVNNSGGEVHTMGIMFLVLLPMPYVDASSAWAFRSKWQRAMVGLAGMYVELGVAAVAAIVWSYSREGSVVNALMYNVMFVAGVSTIVFNANPLLRYDGYYILSDLLEMPNLAQRSTSYLYYLVKRYIFGVRKPVNPANTLGERPWLVAYGIASSIYRVIVSVGIIFFVVDKLFIVGAIMAIGGLIGWVIVPVGKFVRYLLVGPEIGRVRVRAIAVTGLVAAAIAVGVGLIRMPDRGRAEGVVMPRDMAFIYMGANGFIENALPSGTHVGPDQAVVRASYEPLLSQRDQLNWARKELEARYRAAHRTEIATAQAYLHTLTTINTALVENQRDIDLLEVHPPLAGTWISPDIDHVIGAYRPRGELLGMVANLDTLQVRVVTDQNLGPRIATDLGNPSVEVRVKGKPDLHTTGKVDRLLPAQKQLSTEALGWGAGGEIAVEPDDPKGRAAAEPFFEVWINPEPGAHLMAGQRVVVRFEMTPKPLIAQWWRTLRQTIQRRFNM